MAVIKMCCYTIILSDKNIIQYFENFVFDTSSNNKTRLMNIWNYINSSTPENKFHRQNVRPYTKALT